MPARREVQSTNPRDWYTLNRHRKRAKHQLQIEPWCRICRQKGITTPARLADHIIPHRGDWNSFRMGKLQSLCWPCHSRTKKLIDTHGHDPRVGIDGFPLDPAHPVWTGKEATTPKPDHDDFDVADLIG